MNILIFGVSNVGKSTIGALLAERLEYKFFDIDEEIKSKYKTTLTEFTRTGTVSSRDLKRSQIVKQIIRKNENTVIAVSPVSYVEHFMKILRSDDVFSLVIADSPENIYNRIIFSDDEDNVYKDDEYRDAHRDYYLNEIKKDIRHYEFCTFQFADDIYDINGMPADEAADWIAADLEEILD